jgi:hypothetical protein
VRQAVGLAVVLAVVLEAEVVLEVEVEVAGGNTKPYVDMKFARQL